MTVKILGPGCGRCQRLYLEARRALEQSGIQADLVKVDDIEAIMAHGVMMTPALVIDDEVKASGRIPSATEIAGWLREPRAIA